MMGTESKILGRVASAFCLGACLALSATAAPRGLTPLARVGVVDARAPGAEVTMVADARLQGKSLKFFRLPGLLRQQAECCIRSNRGADKATQILRYEGEDTTPALGWAGTLTTASDDGFLGLVLLGDGVHVRRINTQRFVISWSKQAGRLEVEQCLSSEGLHLRLKETSHPRQSVHYYVALGMAVEPTCAARQP
jgi:hypothetical protein